MPATYEPIATTTLSSATQTVSFTSIPSTYTDLKLVLFAIGESANSTCWLTFNSDTLTNYAITRLYGFSNAGSSNIATSQARIDWNYNSLSTTIPTLLTADIFSYANTSVFKSCLVSESGDRNGSGMVNNGIGLWRSTSAISSIQITTGLSPNRLGSGTIATLYGIKAA